MTPALTLPARPTLRLWDAAPALSAFALLVALAAIPLLAAAALDPRSLQGEGIWVKPLKFHLALTVYFATLAIFARWMPAGMMETRGWRIYQAVIIACTLGELLWIGGAAALGTASHFNLSSPAWAMLYPLMGVFAVTLTSMTLVMGMAIWRNTATGLPAPVHLSVALGLVLTFVLTVLAASILAQGTGHLVGTPVTGARLPLLGWSREVGDLRAPHFLATHAMHVLPLAGLSALALPSRAQVPAVWIAAAAFCALVLWALATSLAGRPLV